MANDNKRFLDKLGVKILWDKINEYFSQIGHRHETSDVNGLDEYMEENAKAIRDTEKVIEILPTLPLYPSEEQVGNIYACNGRLYRTKKLNTLTLDFNQIEPNEQGYVTREIFMDFINQNGMNIVMDYGEDEGDFTCSSILRKDHDVLYLDTQDFSFIFSNRNYNSSFSNWNNIYIKRYSVKYQSEYHNEYESVEDTVLNVVINDLNGNNYHYSVDTSGVVPPPIEIHNDSFGENGSYPNINYGGDLQLYAIDDGLLVHSIELELVTCNSLEDYNEGIFHDFLVWEEVSEEELPIEDTTPATEETTKRFYREVENNNIYVTDRETEITPGGFDIIVTHNKTNSRIDESEELRNYIDPKGLWINGEDTIDNIYADNKHWTDVNGKEVVLTPIIIGTGGNTGGFAYNYTKPVTLCFTPFISWDNSIQKPVLDSKEAPIVRVTWYDYEEGSDFYEDYTIEKFDNDYLLDLNQLKKHYTEITLPAGNVDYFYLETVDDDGNSKRCHLHEIYYGSKETTYKWSQIAKIQDIEDAINALPEVARTGSYTDLFNKPCIGDVQTYDWPNDEDLPIIEEGQTDSCENRFKQLLRWNNSLYTAVQNEYGLSLDLRQFSRDYKTQGYCGNSLRNFIFQDRIDIASAAYEDYYVSGNGILIQNTKGRGMQLGSGNGYGDVLLAMRDEGDNKRFLFNEVEVDLQSWNGPDSDMKDYTTDNANIYVEIGTSQTQEIETPRYEETGMELFVDWGMSDGWSLRKFNGDLSEDDLGNFINNSGSTIYINNEPYVIDNYLGVETDEYGIYCRVVLNRYDYLDDSQGYTTFILRYDYTYSHILTPQQTKNVWFKKYGDEYVEEWEETSCWTDMDEAYEPDDYICYYVYDDNTGDYAYDFLYSLVENQVLKIDGVEVIVKEVYPDDGLLYTYYNNNVPSGHISILRRRYINNPVLKETVKLTGTNCDYLKIWTQYDEEPEQYGRGCVIRNIVFNDIKYEFDSNPTYNRVFYRKDYWKQISGNGSIKVIDLLDEN